ncbi:MAG: ABC-F family ATP-binding cassette domain-containing protein [Clostridia bacterium]|nr:ABC-F family ATP-binding cassette domain-containing protein [Clostridia bacterium]
MQVLSAQKIRLSFGVEEILKGADLTIDTGARIGLVGQNGCGKSTLLRVLTGEYEPDSGTVSVPRGIRIGYLEQIVSPFGEGSVWNQLLEVFAPVFRMEEELRALEHRMGIETGAEYDRIVNRYDRLMREFEDAGGYAYKSRIQGTLIGLGFTPDQYDQEASTLSGGQQARLALARLLLSNPDLLLLDEPTNHLDLSAVQWLEDFLRSFRGAILIVSHDRYFLNTLATEIVELHQGVTERYAGNYTHYLEERKTRREIREKAWQLQQQEIQRQEDIIEKLRSYNREKSIKRARSREKILEKIQVLDRPDQEESLTFRFQEDISSGEDVLFAEHLSKAFGPLTLFEEYHLHVRRGERIAIIGPNGCGKSTLLKILCGRLAPDEGYVRRGTNVEIGYFDQQQSELLSSNTVIEELHDSYPFMTLGQLRGALAVFYFRGDDVFKPLAALSGGEKARLSLLKLMLHHDNTLLLDEPTNHLDADVREALETAMEGFRGTVIAVSHDRYFINRFANRILCFEKNGTILDVPGNYDDFLAHLERLKNPEIQIETSTLSKTAQRKQQREERESAKAKKQLRETADLAETRVMELEEALEQCSASMSVPDLSPEDLLKASQQYADLEKELAEAMDLWEKAAGDLEDLTAEPQ